MEILPLLMPPVSRRQIDYPHRTNKDGTIDSICPLCFMTVGTSTWESDLARMEAVHVCKGERLKYLATPKADGNLGNSKTNI